MIDQRDKTVLEPGQPIQNRPAFLLEICAQPVNMRQLFRQFLDAPLAGTRSLV